MHVLLITPQLMSTSMLVQSLKRQNIVSLVYAPGSLDDTFCIQADAVLIPHPLSELMGERITPFLENLYKGTPIFILKKNINPAWFKVSHKVLSQCIFLDTFLADDELALLVRDVIQKNGPIVKESEVQCGDLLLNRLHWSLHYKKKRIHFNKKEFFLLELFIQNVGHVTTRDSIVRHVWDKRQYVAANTIDVYVSRLRKKLRSLASSNFIETVPCLGYQLNIR